MAGEVRSAHPAVNGLLSDRHQPPPQHRFSSSLTITDDHQTIDVETHTEENYRRRLRLPIQPPLRQTRPRRDHRLRSDRTAQTAPATLHSDHRRHTPHHLSMILDDTAHERLIPTNPVRRRRRHGQSPCRGRCHQRGLGAGRLPARCDRVRWRMARRVVGCAGRAHRLPGDAVRPGPSTRAGHQAVSVRGDQGCGICAPRRAWSPRAHRWASVARRVPDRDTHRVGLRPALANP
jgi:hypothetical protein